MPLFLVFIGIAFMLLAWQNNQGEFVTQVGTDLSSGFFPWMGAILAIGALGYIPAAKGFSRGILGLILLVFILVNGKGLFNQLQSALGQATPADPATKGPSEGFTPSPAAPSVIGSSGLIQSTIGGLD